MRYRKRAVTVEATQWNKNGDHPRDYALPHEGPDGHVSSEQQRAQDWEGQVVRRFRRPDQAGYMPCQHCGAKLQDHGFIETAQGGHRVCPGDWVITLADGETYPCKPDVFARHYEPDEPVYACMDCQKVLPVCDPCEHIDIEPSALASVRRQFGWKPA